MPDEIRVNRVSSQVTSPAGTEVKEVVAKPSKLPWIILVIVVVLLAAAGILFRDKLFSKGGAAQTAGTSAYQAVFLTNGQVYFGKLSHANSDYVTMDDIYYLQVGPQQGSGTTDQTASSTGQSISLVKLGNELHGPVDEMHISRAQVLFYEDLKSDGQVVKAIMQDKATKK